MSDYFRIWTLHGKYMPFVPAKVFACSICYFFFFRHFVALEVDDRQLIKALYGRLPLLCFFFAVFGLYFFHSEVLSNRERCTSQNRRPEVKSINGPCRNIFVVSKEKPGSIECAKCTFIFSLLMSSILMSANSELKRHALSYDVRLN